MDIVEKINKQLINEDIHLVLETGMFFCEYDKINEGRELLPKVKKYINNLSLPKTRKKGLIQIISSSSKEIGKMLWLAYKYSITNNSEFKNELRNMAHKNITKDDMIDFLFKLDVVTLGLLSSPISMIDAITGWNLLENLKSITKSIEERALEAIKSLEWISSNVPSDVKSRIQNYIKGLKNLLSKHDVCSTCV